jgi:hypothetical protein
VLRTAQCLGAQVGENLIHEVVKRGGCARFRGATKTEFNLIYEVRP